MIKSRLILSVILLTALILTTGIIKLIGQPPERFIVLDDIETLTFKDFQAFPPIFTDFEASISTRTELARENNKIVAKTIFDRRESWVYGKFAETDELLTHEKYHAYLTDFGTKVLNQVIYEDKLSFRAAQKRRDSISKIINWLQYKYDKETQHSLNVDSQIYWEYIIDSMHQVVETKPIKEPDFADAEVFFSSPPHTETTVQPYKISSHSYTLKNNIYLGMETHYDFVESINPKLHEEELKKQNDKVEIDSLTLDGLKALRFTTVDSAEQREIVNVIIPHHNRTYMIATSYPEKEIFRNISTNFINSFQTTDHSDLWKDYYDKNIEKDPEIITPGSSTEEEDLIIFTKGNFSDLALLYSNPFEYDDKLLIPFQPVKHELDDIFYLLAIVNEETKITNQIDSLYQMIPIDLSKLKKGENHIQIGYVPIEKDTLEDLNHFYSTHIYYEK